MGSCGVLLAMLCDGKTEQVFIIMEAPPVSDGLPVVVARGSDELVIITACFQQNIDGFELEEFHCVIDANPFPGLENIATAAEIILSATTIIFKMKCGLGISLNINSIADGASMRTELQVKLSVSKRNLLKGGFHNCVTS